MAQMRGLMDLDGGPIIHFTHHSVFNGKFLCGHVNSTDITHISGGLHRWIHVDPTTFVNDVDTTYVTT